MRRALRNSAWNRIGDPANDPIVWWMRGPFAISRERFKIFASHTSTVYRLFHRWVEVGQYFSLEAAQEAADRLRAAPGPAMPPTRPHGGLRNPGRGTLPAILDRCVAHVAPRLADRGPDAALSGAIAICTASAQRRKLLRRGTRTLTPSGQRAERSAVRRAGWSEDAAAVQRLAARARKARRNPALSRSETQGLVEAWGKYIAAGRDNAPIKAQQRLYDQWRRKLDAAERKTGGTLSEAWMEQLRARAVAWLDSQGTRGAGRFW